MQLVRLSKNCLTEFYCRPQPNTIMPVLFCYIVRLTVNLSNSHSGAGGCSFVDVLRRPGANYTGILSLSQSSRAAVPLSRMGRLMVLRELPSTRSTLSCPAIKPICTQQHSQSRHVAKQPLHEKEPAHACTRYHTSPRNVPKQAVHVIISHHQFPLYDPLRCCSVQGKA